MDQPYPGRQDGGFSRPWVWGALVCVGVMLLTMTLVITGGVLYLVRAGSSGSETGSTEATGPEMVSYADENLSLEYPVTWEEVDVDPELAEQAGTVVELRDASTGLDVDEPGSDRLTIYLYSADVHAEVQCEKQAGFIGFAWDHADDPEDVGPSHLGGREVPHHRATGEHGEAPVLGESFCIDVGDQVMEVAVDSFGTGERSEAVEAILASWTWTDA